MKTSDKNEHRKSRLTWLRVLLLTPVAVIGGFIGQIAFDQINTSTDGLLSGFLVNIVIQPIVRDFWHSFDMSTALLRWVVGSGALALSIAFYLRASTKKTCGMLLAGCLSGLFGFLLSGFLLEIVPMQIYGWLAFPFTIGKILPPMIICFFIGLVLKETRRLSWKFALAGLLGGLLGAKLTIFSPATLLRMIGMMQNNGFQHINPVRLIDTFFVMLFTNLLVLSFLNESLRFEETQLKNEAMKTTDIKAKDE
jgi:uncharacterized membrane protein YfcA